MGPEVLVVRQPPPRIVSNADGATASAPFPTPSPYRSPRAHVVGTLALVSMLAVGAAAPLPSPPTPKPRGYRVHFSKAERRGRTPADLQALREARLP